MAEAEIVYVAVIPLGNPSINLAKAVSGIIGKDAYQTRLLLVGSIPRIVVRCSGMKEAEATAHRLRDTGLTTIVIGDAELRKPFQGLRVKTIEFGDREVTFKGEGGRGVAPGAGDVFLIIKGTRQSVVMEAPSGGGLPKAKRKINLQATMMTGGIIPVYKKEHPKTEPLSRTEWFLRLYGRRSPDAVAEILQYNMDYSFLGVETAPSSVTNFINVVKILREIYPKAIYDERLMKSYAVDIPMITPGEDIDINCRLIYFQHLP